MKRLTLALLLLIGGGCDNRTDRSDDISVQRLEDDGETVWVHTTDEAMLFGVAASQFEGDDFWTVSINAAEFVREDPLESRLREAIAQGLGAVEGVSAVEEDDRESWTVYGEVEGPRLVRASVVALQSLDRELRQAIDAF